MQIMEASVLGNGTFRTMVTGFFFTQNDFFSMTLICACEVNGPILGPGLIRHRSVEPYFACLVGRAYFILSGLRKT